MFEVQNVDYIILCYMRHTARKNGTNTASYTKSIIVLISNLQNNICR